MLPPIVNLIVEVKLYASALPKYQAPAYRLQIGFLLCICTRNLSSLGPLLLPISTQIQITVMEILTLDSSAACNLIIIKANYFRQQRFEKRMVDNIKGLGTSHQL